VLAALALGAAPASAQSERSLGKAAPKLPRRTAGFVVQRGWVAMSAGWRDAITAKTRRKLTSGLPTVIAARAYLFAEGGRTPVGLSIKTCRVVFDLWDEVFRIEMRQGGLRRQTVAVNVEGVLRRCGEARRMAIINSTAVEPLQPYFVGMLVEVNPLSKKTMDRIKRWVALPKGAGRLGPGDSLFGSFVGLFVTHVPAADETLRFRTQPFVPASLPVLPVR